ncbi:protein kinase [Corallococcus sp. CA053C]|uniref:protein kinase domain-containing protein n=1 Tax=Corallococcus sp. CA053C TaxID=2316732 RepID=UPI00131536C4|nr:protein kinase [Corallococcus sp. CA053C]
MFDKKQPSHVAFRGKVAERTTQVVAWIGAGLSADAGVPSWAGLKQKLWQALNDKNQTNEDAERKRVAGKLRYLRDETNYWRAFEMLSEELGAATYNAVIRQALDPALSAKIPKTCESLWKIRVNGILNMNLDRLATRAFNAQHVGEVVHEVSGKQVAGSAHVLSGHRPFIANLHGTMDDSSTWVFRQAELDKLWSDEGYKAFLSACLMTRTVLFVGLTADDTAVGGHLERLKSFNVKPESLFWVTNRRDTATDRWAESVGMRLIRYGSDDCGHGELQEFFDDLVSFRSVDEVPPPVSPQVPVHEVLPTLPTQAELMVLDAEEIRKILNAHAAEILAPQTEDAYARYEEFCDIYDQAIYRAWYVSTSAPFNRLLGFTLTERIASGAFGTVYRATSPDGQSLAIKVLHEGIRKQQNLLRTFRRGVRSMQILSSNNVKGMVPYLQYSEIPAFVAMEMIEGPNLKEAVEAQQINEWGDRLRIGKQITEIILSAHHLQARVLHRDIRPPNIMLRDFYQAPELSEVVVLDFDLSWHKGASENSIVFGNSLSGYLAPEQLSRAGDVSTRNAAVDSFGLGMTLYFLATGNEPLFGQHQHRNWGETLGELIATQECNQWRSLPNRYSRLVERSTLHKQSIRWGVSDVRLELARLLSVWTDPSTVDSAELLAEEILARSDYVRRYKWSDEELSGEIELPTGVFIRARGRELEKEIVLEVSWSASGTEDRKNLVKYLPKSSDSIISMLKRVGCKILNSNITNQSVDIVATASVYIARKYLNEFGEAIDKITGALRF